MSRLCRGDKLIDRRLKIATRCDASWQCCLELQRGAGVMRVEAHNAVAGISS